MSLEPLLPWILMKLFKFFKNAYLGTLCDCKDHRHMYAIGLVFFKMYFFILGFSVLNALCQRTKWENVAGSLVFNDVLSVTMNEIFDPFFFYFSVWNGLWKRVPTGSIPPSSATQQTYCLWNQTVAHPHPRQCDHTYMCDVYRVAVQTKNSRRKEMGQKPVQ